MKVSICSSLLNQVDLARGMMASIIGQSFKDWELIVVDDGSTEDVKGLCEEWNDDRIKYHRFEVNRGVPHGINYALSLATGEYCSVISADERLDLNKLLWQVGYLDENSQIGGIWGLPQNGPLGERPEHEQYALKAHNRSREAWIRTLLRVESIPIGGASWLVRKSVLDDIGTFDPQFYTCSDLELFVRFFKKYEGRVFPYRWAWEETNPSSISRNLKPGEFQRDIANVRAKHELDVPPTTGRVTVAIPVKNMATTIPATLASLRAQTFREFDILVLDDASTDDTLKVVEAVISSTDDCNITPLQLQGESVGPITAQNHMLGVTKNEFFVVLAADDTVDPTFLEKCMAQFKADPWLEFVGTQTDFIKEDGTPHTEPHPFKDIVKAGNKPREQWLSELYYGNQYFGAGMYRTKALKEVGGWNAAYGVIADYEMYVKLLQRENIYVVQENLTHTRIHDGQRSLLKTKPQQLELRQHYHMAHVTYWPPRMKVIIATPFYMMQGFTPYISCLVGTASYLAKSGIECEFWELSGDSYVDRAKNTLVNKFLEDPDATHLFMIDSDMQWDLRGFLTMLMMPEDIVMASYPQKNGWNKWTALPHLTHDEKDGKDYPTGRALNDGSALIKAEWLAGGFIRFSRKCLQEYKDKYTDLVYYDPGADPSYPERLYTEFFICERSPMVDGRPMRWGEDRVFGRRMKEIGIEGWIYPNVSIGHYGIKGWTGNYHQFIMNGVVAQ